MMSADVLPNQKTTMYIEFGNGLPLVCTAVIPYSKLLTKRLYHIFDLYCFIWFWQMGLPDNEIMKHIDYN